MIERTYVWDVIVPADRTPEEALRAAQSAAERVSTYNRDVLGAEAVLTDEGALKVSVRFIGRDQWWIKRKIVYAIGAILVQSKIPRSHASLVDIQRPPDRRSVRVRASDGRHNPLPTDTDIDHGDMGLVTP